MNRVSPITYAQQGVYVECMLDPENLRYNLPIAYTFPKGIKAETVRDAAQKVMECHPSFFSHFEDRNGEVVQVYAEQCDAVVALTEATDEEAEKKKKSFARAFDLLHGPLYRAEVLSTPSGAVFLLDVHHLVYDGSSWNIFIRELCAAHEGCQPVEEASTYADFAYAQKECTADHRAYYDTLFALGAASAMLPGDLNGDGGQHLEHTMAVSTEDVMTKAKQLGTAPSALFMAAAFYTLSRYTNTKNLCMTTISNGRQNPLSHGVVGMFVNTIPLVTKIEDVTVKDYIYGIRQMYLDTRKHEEYPFASIVSDYGVEQKVRFTYQYGTTNTLFRINGEEVRSEYLWTNSPTAPLTITISGIGRTPAITINYDSSVYSADFVSRFAESMDAVVAHFLAAPDRRLLATSIMSERQAKEVAALRHTCLDASAIRFPLFHSSLEYWAEHTPGTTAVIACNETLTYRALNEKANTLAHALIHKGVAPGDRICLLLPRTSWHLIAMFGVLKSGAAYIPCDPEYPAERINLITEDSHARYVITTQDKMADYGERALNIEDILEEDMPKTNPAIEQESDSLAYLIYTSGSTGRPKGVMLRHIGICNYLTDHAENRHFHALVHDCKTMLCITTVSFDLSLKEIGASLFNGMTLVMANEEQVNDPQALAELMLSTGVDGFSGTPSRLKMFLDLPDFQKAFSQCKFIVLGGEKYPPTLLPQVKELAPEARLFNTYGPTEISVSCNGKELTHAGHITIGRPLLNVKEYVVDNDLNELPVGVTGELLIGGLGVSAGYNDLPEKTAEAFIDYKGERCYKSGDYAYWNEEGEVIILGRKDHQIKLNGLRIELGEVETVLNKQPQVKEGVVMIRNVNGHDHLVAYYTVKENVDENILKSQMATSLTDYMVPTIFMQLDKMPISPNGKTDLKALPEPVMKEDDAEDAAPRELNILETKLADLVAEILQRDSISMTSPLRHSGLTSLLSIKLAAQLYKEFGIKFKVKEILSQTLLDIENQILSQMFAAPQTAVAEPSALAPAVVDEAPLTFAQQGVYIDCLMNPDTTMYNIPHAFTFPAGVSTGELTAKVIEVAKAHPSLFCQFCQGDDSAVMRRVAGRTLEVVVKDLTEEELSAEKESFVRPFDLENDLLIRAEIVNTPDGRHHLLIDIHHLVSDGSSFNIFISQLIRLLNGEKVEAESYDYLRFAAEQKAQADRGGMNDNKAFYDEMFAQFESAATVPADKTASAEGHPQHALTPIPASLMQLQLPEGVSLAHFWFAAFSYALSRYADTKDVYTCFVSNGRQNLDITDTVGMFVNTLPCAVHVKDQTIGEYLIEVSKSFAGVIDHEDYPIARIATDYDFKDCATFAYQLGLFNDYRVDNESVEVALLGLNKAKTGLSIFVQDVDGVPCVDAEYDDSKYTNDLILHFTESMVAVAEHFVDDMTAKVKNVSIMSERQRMEVEGMHSVNEDLSFPVRTFHEGIEQWAVKTPDAVALMACDRNMTYREYNAEANQMARALVSLGMKRGDRVVLLLPRRSYYLTALFAVMKCGGAFIPMDPEYPAERIAFILDDSEGRFVITTPEKVADYPDRAIDIFQLLEEAKAQPSENLDVKVDPHDLAYLIYTSGSTGRPKGVMIEHLGAASFLTFYKSDTNFGADAGANRVGLCQSTVSFDLSVGEIGVQVFNGDTVAFASEDEMMSPVEMIKLCRRTGAQTISGTPSRLAVNLELPEYYDLIKNQMKCVVTGGEKLPGALLDELEKMDVYIINTYGPTETTMGSSAGVLNGTREVHVGKPFTNYTYQVLDSDLGELPVGVMGELCIGGIGLARGYNNLPERTAETFIEWQGKRIYRTGDYAMWTKDGNIIIMGRTDNQVKLNGLRIELGEIETVMSQQPGMRQCVAIIRKLGNIDKLIGYYTVDETVAHIPVADYEEQVRADMAVKLTPYMVPGIFVRLDEMPLTPVGKTDVKRLPMPDLQTGEYVAPKNDVEKTFCEIFAKILNLKRISATDNFFELGGTSLVAMQLIGEASKVGYNIVYKSIFDNATPHLLARMLKPELYQGEDTKKKLPMADEIEAYDYAQLDDILAANTIDNFRNGKCYDQMGNVLLAGATGFLGIHVLHNLIERNDVPCIYCLVRSNKVLSAKSRLRTQLFYYFANAYDELFENGRITVIEGDVTHAEVFEQFCRPLDVVINCAANVKHFSAGTDIEDINIKGCQNCIDLCLRTGARFIQTSTGSIAGNSVGDAAATPIIFTERDLYRNQELTTKYSASKFLAERSVLDAVKNRGLKGKIMRLGNLSARSTDGEFQINFRSNNAMATLKAFQVLGCIPYEREFGYSEFSPINEVADAIVRLSMTPDCCTVFQPGNVHWPPYGDIIECMNRIGIPIERVEQDEFQRRLAAAMGNPEKADLVQSLVAYREASDGRVHVTNGWDTKAYTGQVLLRLGFRWSFTTWDYVERYLRCLQGLGVFDSDFKR